MLDRGLSVLELSVLYMALGGLVTIAFGQVVLRNAADLGWSGAGALLSSMPWIDVVLRHLVLWLAFAGAARTTRRGEHLGIDLLGRSLGETWLRVYAGFYGLVGASFCALASVVSLDLVSMERDAGSTLFRVGTFPIATWAIQLALPLGFGLLAVRFLLRALAVATRQVSPRSPAPGGAPSAALPPSDGSDSTPTPLQRVS